jgi:hypothetical protein
MVMISESAKLRVGRIARAADNQLRKELTLALREQSREQTNVAWKMAFCRWAETLLDAAVGELLAEPQGVVQDFEAVLHEGPGKWVRNRAYYPDTLGKVVLPALADAGVSLPDAQSAEMLVPFQAIQSAVRERAQYWIQHAEEYESPEAGVRDARGEKSEGTVSLSAVDWPWENLTITFVGDQDVMVKSPIYTGPRTFRELGFGNLKNGKPVNSWSVLYAMGVGQGEISATINNLPKWPQVEKAVQDMRRRLKQAFRRSDDPLHTITHGRHRGGYQARFNVGLGPGIEPPVQVGRKKSLGHGPDN